MPHKPQEDPKPEVLSLHNFNAIQRNKNNVPHKPQEDPKPEVLSLHNALQPNNNLLGWRAL